MSTIRSRHLPPLEFGFSLLDIDPSRRHEAQTGQTALRAAHAAGLSGGTATRWEPRAGIRWHYG